jgi:hypothetical protein
MGMVENIFDHWESRVLFTHGKSERFQAGWYENRVLKQVTRHAKERTHSIPSTGGGVLAVRDVERIVLGRGSVTGLVNLRHGFKPLRMMLRVRSPNWIVRILLGRNSHWILGFLREDVLLRERGSWLGVWNCWPSLLWRGWCERLGSLNLGLHNRELGFLVLVH